MDRDPYWSRPWPSAVALAKLILQQPSIVADRRVCEVGAGLGIASIAAALAGGELPHPIALHATPTSVNHCTLQMCASDKTLRVRSIEEETA